MPQSSHNLNCYLKELKKFIVNILFLDEKEKYDPFGFRDYILGGLNGAGTDLEAIWKFLDQAGSKVDYRRYGEVLFDILIAGGLLGKSLIKMILTLEFHIIIF